MVVIQLQRLWLQTKQGLCWLVLLAQVNPLRVPVRRHQALPRILRVLVRRRLRVRVRLVLILRVLVRRRLRVRVRVLVRPRRIRHVAAVPVRVRRQRVVVVLRQVRRPVLRRVRQQA